MKRNPANWRSVVTIVAIVIGLSMPTSMALVYADSGNSNPRVLPPQSLPYGKTYSDWSIAWWQWVLSIPAASNPILDTTGANCGVGQAGPVWFLAGTSGSATTRACTVPAGKALLFPIINVENDYPCPDPNFQPAPGQSMEDFLTEGAQYWIDHVTALNVDVDGVPLQNLFDYRATSALFNFTGDPSLTAAFDPCITGTSQPAVSDGYWLMLAPLSPGNHTVHFHGTEVFDWGSFDVEVTYHLTVTR